MEFEYNRSTGIIRDKAGRRREVELTKSEMEIAEVLFDWKWHGMEEIEERVGVEGQRRRVQISKMKKKVRKYIDIEIDRKGRRYKCERIKRKKERQ